MHHSSLAILMFTVAQVLQTEQIVQGFVMSVYAQFGISLPHSSSAMRSVGYGVSTAICSLEISSVIADMLLSTVVETLLYMQATHQTVSNIHHRLTTNQSLQLEEFFLNKIHAG